MSQANLPRTSVPTALLLCLLNWLVPGAGYLACKDLARGLTLFVTLNLCFAIGVSMGGFVLPPGSWVPMTPQFNLVAALTYITQAFHGGGWLLLEFLQSASGDGGASSFSLTGLASRTYADLGAFHLIAAGALNYFATVRLYDLLAGAPELSEGTSSEPASTVEDQKNPDNSPKNETT